MRRLENGHKVELDDDLAEDKHLWNTSCSHSLQTHKTINSTIESQKLSSLEGASPDNSLQSRYCKTL